MTKKFDIEVDCAACAEKMERATAKTSGVSEASINFMLQKMTVTFDEGADWKAVMGDVLKACRKVEPDCEIEL